MGTQPMLHVPRSVPSAYFNIRAFAGPVKNVIWLYSRLQSKQKERSRPHTGDFALFVRAGAYLRLTPCGGLQSGKKVLDTIFEVCPLVPSEFGRK